MKPNPKSNKSNYLVVRTGKKGNVGSYYLYMQKPLNLSKLTESEIEMIANHDSQGNDSNFANTIIEAINRYLDSGNHQGIKTFLDYFDYLQSKGYDGIIARMYSKYQKSIDNNAIEYAVFNSNQIKSIDNKNPTDSDDIRYSRALESNAIDNEGRELTPEQQEFFKDSKFRNKKGNLISLYHGSNSAGFMQFKEDKPIFLTDDFEHSITYTRDSRNVITEKFNTLESLENFIVSDDFAEYFPFFEDNQDGKPTFAKIKNTPEKILYG